MPFPVTFEWTVTAFDRVFHRCTTADEKLLFAWALHLLATSVKAHWIWQHSLFESGLAFSLRYVIATALVYGYLLCQKKNFGWTLKPSFKIGAPF